MKPDYRLMASFFRCLVPCDHLAPSRTTAILSITPRRRLDRVTAGTSVPDNTKKDKKSVSVVSRLRVPSSLPARCWMEELVHIFFNSSYHQCAATIGEQPQALARGLNFSQRPIRACQQERPLRQPASRARPDRRRTPSRRP